MPFGSTACSSPARSWSVCRRDPDGDQPFPLRKPGREHARDLGAMALARPGRRRVAVASDGVVARPDAPPEGRQSTGHARVEEGDRRGPAAGARLRVSHVHAATVGGRDAPDRPVEAAHRLHAQPERLHRRQVARADRGGKPVPNTRVGDDLAQVDVLRPKRAQQSADLLLETRHVGPRVVRAQLRSRDGVAEGRPPQLHQHPHRIRCRHPRAAAVERARIPARGRRRPPASGGECGRAQAGDGRERCPTQPARWRRATGSRDRRSAP